MTSISTSHEPRGLPPEGAFDLAALAELLVDRICRHSPAALGYRRSRTELDLLSWGRRFLPAYFRLPPSKMHRWLGGELARMRTERGARLNVLGPRGSAKSTVGTLCYALKCAVEGAEPYIWIVSAISKQAQTHLENIKTELEQNPKLARVYPRGAGRGPVWRSGVLQLNNGVTIEAYGIGQQLRGRRRREARPSLIICDDVENDLRAASADQRAACRTWFHGALLKAGDERTNVVNLATALHRDALAMQLHAATGWKSALFKSIDPWPENLELWREWEEVYVDRDNPLAARDAKEFFWQRRDQMSAGAEVLWPEHESLYALMRMRVDEGRTAFEREKQNSPIDPERCEWPEEYFDHHIWFRQWPKELAVRTIALDPSKGADARHGDYSAFVLLGMDREGVLYVEADLARRPTPEMVMRGVSLCTRFNPDALGIEANQFQELLGGEFEAEFRRQRKGPVPQHLIHNHTNKLVRIRTLGPLLSRRELRFLAKSPATRLLVDQLRDFPLGDHDDGPDALEMAIRLAGELVAGRGAGDGLGDRLPIGE